MANVQSCEFDGSVGHAELSTEDNLVGVDVLNGNFMELATKLRKSQPDHSININIQLK